MERAKGYPFYGPQVGILVFGGTAPRIPGDPGNSQTFEYPVHYRVVEGSFTKLFENDKRTKENLLDAVEELAAYGIHAIVGDCGLMGKYQGELARLGLAVAASSLCQIPTIWQLVGRRGKIGILTGHSEMLDSHCLSENGCTGIPLVIQGMETQPHFKDVIIDGHHVLDPLKMRIDVLNAVKSLLLKDADISAFVLECSNLATYSADVYALTQLPVFDILSAANLVKYSVNPPTYL